MQREKENKSEKFFNGKFGKDHLGKKGEHKSGNNREKTSLEEFFQVKNMIFFCFLLCRETKNIFAGWAGGMVGWLNCIIYTPAIQRNPPCFNIYVLFRIGKFFKISKQGHGKFFKIYVTIYIPDLTTNFSLRNRIYLRDLD